MSERPAGPATGRHKIQKELTPEEIEIRRLRKCEDQRLFRARHPEKVREARALYKLLHPEKAEQWRIAYRKRWPDRVKDSARRYDRKYNARRRERKEIGCRRQAAIQAFSEGASLNSNGLFQRINAALPHGLPQFIRDDVASEIALAVLEGAVPVDEIERHAKKCLRAHNRMFDQYGTVSLDEEIPGTDGLTYGDRLAYEDEEVADE